ncbi:MAG: TerB family tellurite resistance protein [Hyphomonas sp.]|uniref:TerB family tellurite resistance protein n=1 Tax=Hyphomonas sp. TaxID=87 RepID=UPI003527EAEA
MIIFGTKATRKLLDKGSFDCPQCNQTTNFEKRRARKWFHLYFIPVIPLETFPAYVECKGCKGTFVEGVLNGNTGATSDNIRAEFEKTALAILVRMAWADGKIEPEEVDAIEQVVNMMCARDFTRAEVEAEIAAAKDSLDDALSVATRAGHMLNDEGKEMILSAVFQIAAADGNFAREEEEAMLEIGAGLGLRPAHVRGMVRDLVEQATHTAGQATH